jgi:hypothetical protein
VDTKQVANQLVELLRQGKFEEAQEALFAEDALNIEMPEMAEGPLGNATGLDAIRRKNAAWNEGLEQVHSMKISDPLVAGNWFALTMSMDITLKGVGRTAMDEICVYQVRNGRIAREQFFYDVTPSA